MRVIDQGHVYKLWQLGTEEEAEICFIKRSGGAIKYDDEWPGVQVQEVLRVLIDRSLYLNNIINCVETLEAVEHLRGALFCYEARAYRRKQEGLNRDKPEHDDSARPRPWREFDYEDVPFNEYEIEKRPIGEDGHIIWA